MNFFKGKVYLLTGGSSGIGKCIGENLTAEGAVVLNVDLTPPAYAVMDIAIDKNLDNLFEKIVCEYGTIDGIINNACVTKGGIFDCTYEQFLYVQKVGVVAPFYLAKLFKNKFNEGGAIVNISSTRWNMSQANTESYSSAKGGITSLTHAMSVSLAGKVRVNAVSPGWIDTTESQFIGSDNLQHTVNRVGKPQDIAQTVLFLLSSQSSFINGQNIVVDGGMSKLMVYHNDCGWTYDGNKKG